MTVRSAKPFEMPIAIAIGLVSHDVPSLTVPSGSVIWIGFRSRSEGGRKTVYQKLDRVCSGTEMLLTSVFCILSRLDGFEHFQSVIDEIWLGVQLDVQK